MKKLLLITLFAVSGNCFAMEQKINEEKNTKTNSLSFFVELSAVSTAMLAAERTLYNNDKDYNPIMDILTQRYKKLVFSLPKFKK